MERIKTKKTESIVLLGYVVLLIVMSCFHEPWFDENQAWDIARSASLHDILFMIPHYEGHPPLWYLLLLPFAKTGMPPDFSLHFINILFCTAAMYLLLFRSPFPKLLRCLLPFTYFFCYQYGVISRPYSVMLLSIFLAAGFYRERDQKPWPYVLSLLLLCLSSAYGIIMAGGLCLHWTGQILNELYQNGKLKTFWRDKRFLPLLCMLIAAILLCLMLIPADDCYYAGVDDDTTLLEKMTNYIRIGIFLILPFDVWFGQAISYTGLQPTVEGLSEVDLQILLAESILSIFFWLILWKFLHENRKFLLFLIPYCLCGGFMAIKYAYAHHTGVICFLQVFVLWTVFADGLKIPELFRTLPDKIESAAIRKAITGVLCLLCSIPIVNTVVSMYYDIRYVYGNSEMIAFIKENHLEDRNLMVRWVVADEWKDVENPDAKPQKEPEKVSENPEKQTEYLCIQGLGASLMPYFDHNIFMNFNAESPDDFYMHYKYKEDQVAMKALWAEKGLPDFMIGGYCPLDTIYDEETLKGERYVPIAEFYSLKPFKLFYLKVYQLVFIRESLLDEYPQFHMLSSTQEVTDP